MNKQKLAFIFIIIIILLTSTSCWNSKELNELAILMGLGLDKDESSNKVQITAQVINVGEIKNPEKSEASTSSNAFWNIKTTQDTLFEAIRKTTFISNRKLFWAHNQIFIIGEDIAKDGISKYTDFLIRDHEIHRTLWVLVSKGKASEILEIKPRLEQIPSKYIAQLVEVRTNTSQVSGVTLQEFYERLISKTTAPIASLIEIVGEGKEKSVRLSGTAVFKDDKLVGELNTKESRGLLWVLDKVKTGVITLDSNKSEKKVSIEIVSANSKIIPEIKNNQIDINIEITEEGSIAEVIGYDNIISREFISLIKERQSDIIYNEIISAFNKSQKLNADIFGFGDAIHRKYPKQWKQLEDQWDEIFPNINLNVKVNTTIKRAGMTRESVTSK